MIQYIKVNLEPACTRFSGLHNSAVSLTKFYMELQQRCQFGYEVMVFNVLTLLVCSKSKYGVMNTRLVIFVPFSSILVPLHSNFYTVSLPSHLPVSLA